ncbi:MAG: hypothetical protein RID07_09615, partial [Lacipirellulaceae bacterium]
MPQDQSTLFEDSRTEVGGLYTTAILAEVLRVPVEAVRRWHRRGAVLAVCTIKKLPYFDFQEATVARKLAALWHAGRTLQEIEREYDSLVNSQVNHQRPLADPRLVVVGQRLLWREGDRLTEPGVKLLIGFEDPIESDRPGRDDLVCVGEVVSLPMSSSSFANDFV